MSRARVVPAVVVVVESVAPASIALNLRDRRRLLIHGGRRTLPLSALKLVCS
jgi:hypothetical protein